MKRDPSMTRDLSITRDHGGNSDQARAQYGGGQADWIDLSTGINRVPFPVPALSPQALTALPTESAKTALISAARSRYQVAEAAAILPLSGAQAAIQLVPRLRTPGTVAILGPTYNEHAAAFLAEGWTVVEVETLQALAGHDAAVVVNPNNPDGAISAPEALLELSASVGLLIVDESFGDIAPDLSLCPHAGKGGLVILRSLGKFYGLAGVRLGFAIGAVNEIAHLAERAGPWAVSGPALEIGQAALSDGPWAEATRRRLATDARRLDRLTGLALVGGTDLFRLYQVEDAKAVRGHLAENQIWSRIFPWSDRLIRLGLPGSEAEWTRVEKAFLKMREGV